MTIRAAGPDNDQFFGGGVCVGDIQWVSVGAGRLAVSNRPKLKAIAKLAAQGCRRIVTIQGRNEAAGQIGRVAKDAGIAWTWVEVGHGTYPKDNADRLMRRGLQELVASLEAGESVLVHCSAGIHRTGMLVFAALRWLGVPQAEALDLIATMRPETREGMRDEHVAWGNQIAWEAGRD
jgi:protein-tyrosine phosphatase